MDKQEQEDKPKKYLVFKTIHHVKDDDKDDYDNDDEDIEENIALNRKQF
ncbi:hypothetical protein NC653_034655 [Populus alba x Populus x berolinensis]|uniref:Uncharacterized protein n=1 Tax=Populus alba x Populus x berolinensis TaxID=444605 RepID=A0AAD6LN50_9ROSI|nr:hypothetical protein NC653_034655 [Populus alba x Populus x berolinensis]